MGESASPSTARVIVSMLLLFAACAVTVPGGLVLRAHPEAYDGGAGTCRSVYLWVTFFLLCTWVATIAVIALLFTAYKATAPDFSPPRGDAARPNALALPAALTSDKVFRAGLGVTALVWLCFFISGAVLLGAGSCTAQANSLSLYLKFCFWGLIVVIPTLSVCGLSGHVMMQSFDAQQAETQFDPLVEQAEGQLAAAQMRFKAHEAHSAATDVHVMPPAAAAAAGTAASSAAASSSSSSSSSARREDLSVV